MFQSLKVGALHSSPNPTPSQENCRVEFNSSFVDLVFYLQYPSKKDIEVFQHEALRLGVFEASAGMPFLVGEFQDSLKWSFDAPLDVHKLSPLHPHWWESEVKGNLLTAILVDARSNEIVSLRWLGVPPTFVNFLSQSLVRQEVSLPTTSAVDAATMAAYQKSSTIRMLNRMQAFHYFPSC